MTNAAVVPLRPADEPSDERARLIERRSIVHDELARLGKPAALKSAADKLIADISAELRALDEAERAAWAKWAKNPDAEAEPAVSTDARVDLDRRLALARRDSEGAERASEVVSARQLQLGAELREVGIRLYSFAVDDVLTEAEALAGEAATLAGQLSRISERFAGFGDALYEARRAAAAAGNDGQAEVLGTVLSRFGAIERPAVNVDPQRRAAAAGEYLRRLT